ncbi:MAG: hypothetical protein ACO4BJ_09855, partial [Planctomycetota bacterium]
MGLRAVLRDATPQCCFAGSGIPLRRELPRSEPFDFRGRPGLSRKLVGAEDRPRGRISRHRRV